ncbi:MAG: CDP-alcohol phosphatidyltransferase family protein [Elusimicrobia bacterium]|nr:CDP-alcohol phosphatidyltransferase family protein [Elusimicrobiota bacterium]
MPGAFLVSSMLMHQGHKSATPLRVFLPAPQASLKVAGVPAIVRTAFALKYLAPETVLLWGDGLALFGPWRDKLGHLHLHSAHDGIPPAGFVDGGADLLAVSADGFAEARGLAELQAAARAKSRPARWVHHGQTVAVYYPSGSEWARCQPDKLLDPAEADEFRTTDHAWWPADSAEAIHRAKKALYDRLPQPNDGYIAQLDRRISIPISKLLVRTPVTPNQITASALVLGLLGSWLIATGVHSWQVAGALILWFCVILDGCDGEVARLKLLMSPGGGRFDIITDNIVHVALFLGIAAAMWRDDPSAKVLLPLAVLLTGFAACGFSVWWLVLRHPKDARHGAQVLVDKLSSRDFIYLIVVLAFLDKLGWFLWAAAIGSHVVNLAFWVVCRDQKAEG